MSVIRSSLSATSMATRLPAAMVGVALVSLVAAIIVAVGAGRELGQDLNDERILALQGSAVFDVTAHMAGLSRTAEALASSPQAVTALDEFAESHEDLLGIQLADLEEEARAVVTSHLQVYVEPLRSAGRDVELRDISTPSPASIYLQFHYAVDLGVFDAPQSIDDAGDGSTWSEVHRRVHPVYRDVVDRMGLVDLYLVEPDSGYIVYSVRKRPDIGTSLETGPFSGSVLAAIVGELGDDPSQTVVMSDLSSYDPALLTPVGVAASPVMDGPRLVGMLVLMYDSAPITDIMTAGGAWSEAGFPPTGQTYLVAADGTTRSEPRSFIEDAKAHLDASFDAGMLSAEERTNIEHSGTTVLFQRANDAAVLAGKQGDTAVESRRTLIGTDALSSTRVVPIEGIEWFVVTEVDADAAAGDLDDFQELLVVGTATFIVVLAFLAVAWADRIVRPVRDISERLATRAGEQRIDVPTQSPIEFHRLADSFELMAEALQQRRADLASARESRLRLLRRMLPAGVADRIAGGDVESLDEIPQATAAVLVVQGLAALVNVGGETSNLGLLDLLMEEVDELAARHGLERVKVLGDAYFAVCGHDRPLIDHAPRAVAFAADAQNVVRELGSDTVGGLDIGAGVHTGAVTVGTIGGQRLLYDVWGPTVSSAHLLARQARPGQILVSQDTKLMLPDTIELEPQEAGDEVVWILSGQSASRAP